MKALRMLVVVTFSLAPVANVARAQDATVVPLTDAEKLYGLSLIWKEADYNFPLFDQRPSLDWDSAYQAFIPRVLATRSTVDYYRELLRFVALLNDGHTLVTMPSWVREERVFDQPKVRIWAVRGKAIVWNVEQGLASDLPVGSQIVAVNGMPVAEYLEREVYPLMPYRTEAFRRAMAMIGWYVNGVGLLWGRAGSLVAVTVRTPDDSVHDLTLTRDSRSREAEWVRPFPGRRPPFEFRWLDDDVAYVAINTFSSSGLPAQRFDSIAPELHRAAGVVIDVRHNGGGNNGLARQIVARHLAADTVIGATWRARINNAAYRAWGYYQGQEWAREYWPYYTGDAYHDGEAQLVVPDTIVPRIQAPVVVLIGRHTGSAAEDFAIWAGGVENATLVGEPTAGTTGQTLPIDLPGGGTARILTKHDFYPDGREFLGVGVQPDVFVERTVEDVIEDRDAVLERALEVLRNQMR